MGAAELQIDASYDDVADVLYLSSANSSRTKNREDEAGVVFRYDLRTSQPVGATVIDFRECWWPHEERHLEELLAEFFGVTKEQAERAIRSAL